MANIRYGKAAFGNGYVCKFVWDRDGKLFASYGARGVAEHEVELSVENDRLKFGCTCGWEGKKERCHHTVTVLMSICYILRGSTFSEQPPKNWLKPRSDELLTGAPAPGESSGTADIFPALIIDADASEAKTTLNLRFYATPLGANAEIHQAPEVLRHLLLQTWPVVSVPAFCEWLATSDAQRLPIFVRFKSKQIRLTNPVPMRFQATICVQNSDGKVKMWRSMTNEGNLLNFVRLSDRLCFDVGNVRLGEIDPSGWKIWVEFERNSRVQSWREELKKRGVKADPESVPVELERWNALTMETPSIGRLCAAGEVILQPDAGTPIPRPAPQWEVHLTSVTDGHFRAQLYCRAAEVLIPYGASLVRIFEEGLSAIPNTKSQWDLLWSCVADWLDAGDMRDQVVTRLKDTLDAPPWLCSQLQQTFQEFETAIGNLSGVNLHAGIEPVWFQLENAIDEAARIIAPIFRIGGMFIDRDGFSPCFSERFLPSILRELKREFERRGVPVFHENRRVQSGGLSIRLAAMAVDSTLDWFEMRPEVLCDGELIPISKWRSLIGQGVWERDDDTLYLVDQESTEPLARMEALLQLDADSKTIKVSRLAIFDWLALRRAGVECELPPEAEQVLGSLLQLERLPLLVPAASLKAKLRQYQIEGFSWLAFLYHHRFGACLADDMGLGKTIQTIAFFAALRDGTIGSACLNPHLIVLPPTLVFNWQQEIEKFCPGLRVVQLEAKTECSTLPDCDILLASYEMVRRRIELLEAHQFHVVVFDEAQAVKNLAGGRSKAMRRLNARFKICLTGTPLENHAGEYYAIMDLALPGLFGSYENFRRLLEKDHIHILDRARPFVLRRKKETILLELPEKTEANVLFDLTEEQKSFYTRALTEVRREVAEAYGEKPASQAGIVALSALMRLRQICVSPALLDAEHAEVSPKIEFIRDSLIELRDEGHAALVFSQFTKALDLLEKEMRESEIPYLRLDGSTPMKQRAKLVADFQNPEGPCVFLISLKTGGAGLNLTRADYVYHVDPWWNPAAEAQASDRAHRMGQQRPVLVQRLLMRGTVEEKISALKERKQRLFEEIVEGGTTSKASQLTREDFEDLFA